MIYTGYFLIGFIGLVIIGYLLQYLSTLIGDKKVNTILAIVSAIAAVVALIVMYMMIQNELFIYNSFDIAIMTYLMVNIFGIYICLLTSYKLIKLKDTPRSRGVYTIPVVVLFIYGAVLSDSFTEINTDEYKKLTSYSKDISENKEVKALYDEYFPKYSSDDIISSGEFYRLKKINNYKYYLRDEQIRTKSSTTEQMTRKKYLDEARENFKGE
jgi:sensor histidine kinase regulating citrate/malate metabolism